MQFLTFEFAFIILILFLIGRFKLSRKAMSFFFSDLKIYVQPTDKDFEAIVQLKKLNKDPQIETSKKLVRMCDIEEYSSKVRDDNLIELDTFFIFYITSLISIISIEIEKVFCGYGIEMSFAFTFALITILYNVSTLAKPNFKNGYTTYDAQVFYLTFFISFIIINVILFKFDHIINLNINYDNITKIVNDRIDKIVAYQSNISREVVKIDQTHLKLLFSICFSYYVSGMFTVSTRVAYFDVLLLQTEEKLRRTYSINDNSLVKRYKNYSKLRLIYHFFILFLLIDPLFKNFLTNELKFINEVTYYCSIIFVNILTEIFLMIKITRFSSKLFFEQNCLSMIEFSENPQKNELENFRRKMRSMNNKGFEIFPQFVYIILLPLLLFLLFLNRSSCSEEIHNVFFFKSNLNNSTSNISTLANNTMNSTLTEDIKDLSKFTFKKSFIETICYFLLLANYSAKSFFTLVYSYYLSNFSRQGKMYLI